MLNVALIGIGNCGNQIAALAKHEADVDVASIQVKTILQFFLRI